MSFRKLVFWIHLAIGCLAGAIILIMSATGVLLMYQRQVTNWFDRDLRAASPRQGLAGCRWRRCSPGSTLKKALRHRRSLFAPILPHRRR